MTSVRGSRTGLQALGRWSDYAWVAEQTGHTRGQVRKWVTGETDSFPATFAADLEAAGIVSARWLLLGDESSAESQAFRDIAAIVERVKKSPGPIPNPGDMRSGKARDAS